MNDYVRVMMHEDLLSVIFDCEADRPLAIGEKINEINEEAYMNGYNWEAFIDHYLRKHAPDVLVGMSTDPEAGMYAACYDRSAANEARAHKLAEIIRSLIENENELYRIIREEGANIAWD